MDKVFKKKICVVTWIGDVNYGTCLQSFALNKALKNMGFETYMFQNFMFLFGFKHPIYSIKKILKKIINKISSKSKLDDRGKEFAERVQANIKFQYSNINIISYSSKKKIKELLNDTDVFITGSDQIWNPNYLSEEYLLFFVEKKQRRIAYSSSFGTSNIPNRKKRTYIRNLRKFYRIGVREETGLKVIDSMFDYNNKKMVVLDPVMLLGAEQWKKIESAPHKHLDSFKNKFVFSYFVGDKTDYDNVIDSFIKKENIDSFLAVSESKTVHTFGINLPYLNLPEFIWMIHHAEYIFTDSFHLTALSLLFNKKIIVFKRFDDDDVKSQNSRIIDLLSLFGLKSKIYSSIRDFDELKKDYDYERINKLLANKIEQSSLFLKEGIINE